MATEYVTVGKILIKLKISRTTLYNWEKSGAIPRPKRNRSGYRIYDANDVKALEAYAFQIHYPEVQTKLFNA